MKQEPANKKPTVPEVVPLVETYYRQPGNGAGGNLHAVLDDGNVDDRNVQYCLEEARNRQDTLGVEIAELMLRMSLTQRKKIRAFHHRGC